jgi:predicted small secreted protein
MKQLCIALVLACTCLLPACASLSGPGRDVQAANSLVENKKFNEAVSRYQEVIRDHPDSSWAVDAQYGLATVYVSSENPQRDYSQALHEFDEFIRLYPNDPRFQDAQNWRHALRILLDLNKSIQELKELDIQHEEKRRRK